MINDARAKLINYKNTAQLALLMLNEEVELMMVKRLTLYAVNHAHPVTLKMTILN